MGVRGWPSHPILRDGGGKCSSKFGRRFRGLDRLTPPSKPGYPKAPMAEAQHDSVDEYRKYLERFEKEVVEHEFGAYIKHNGRLIKKLSFEDFESRWLELA